MIKIDPLPKSEMATGLANKNESFDLWRESIQPIFDCHLKKTEQTFVASTTAFQGKQIIVTRTLFDPQYFSRKPSNDCNDVPCLLIQLYLSGGYKGVVGGQVRAINPGDISVIDLSLDVKTSAAKSDVISFVIPNDMPLFFDVNFKFSANAYISSSTKVGQFLGEQIKCLWRYLPDLPASDADIQLSALASTILNTLVKQSGYSNHYLEEAPFIDKVVEYIRHNLSDDNLSVDHLAKRFHCSRATLYRNFTVYGGVKNYIRVKRLNECYKLLINENPGPGSVRRIAGLYGFHDMNYFSRCFMKQFGERPSGVSRQKLYPVFNRGCTEKELPQYFYWLDQIQKHTQV